MNLQRQGKLIKFLQDTNILLALAGVSYPSVSQGRMGPKTCSLSSLVCCSIAQGMVTLQVRQRGGRDMALNLNYPVAIPKGKAIGAA